MVAEALEATYYPLSAEVAVAKALEAEVIVSSLESWVFSRKLEVWRQEMEDWNNQPPLTSYWILITDHQTLTSEYLLLTTIY